MLRFVYGYPGNEKSKYLAELISSCLKAGKKVILIVPEHCSVSAETSVTEVCGDLYKMNLEILSFKRLCNRVFREYGGLCYHYAGKGGQMLMMWRALSAVKDELTYYKDLRLSDSGTVEAMLDSIVTFRRSCISSDKFEEAAKNCPEDKAQLKKKLNDLVKIGNAYSDLLHEKYNDPEEDLTRMRDIAAENDFFADKEVFVDSVPFFTAQEMDVLKVAIAQSETVTVSFDCQPKDERPLFDRMMKMRDQLSNAALENGMTPVTLKIFSESSEEKSKDLAEFEKWLFDDEKEPEKDYPHLYTDSFESVYEECKAVAARILRNVQAGGRYMDHAVIARNPETYMGIIDRVFEANGIPYIKHARVRFDSRSCCRMIFSALDLVAFNFRREDLLTYMKTGFSGISPDECFLLEDYMNLWKIEGRGRWLKNEDFLMNPDGHSAERSEETHRKLEGINAAKRKLMGPLQAFDGDMRNAVTVKDRAEAIFGLAKNVCLQKQLKTEENAAKSAGLGREAQLHAQSMKILCDILDELVNAAGDVKCTMKEFIPMLFILCKAKDMGSIPTGEDRVLISDSTRLKPGSARVLYAVGMNEGEFPAPPKVGGMFTASELEYLNAEDICLGGGRESAVHDEEYTCYRVLTLPYGELYVSSHRKDLRGNIRKPSELFDRISDLVKDRKKEEDFLYGKANCLERAFVTGDDPYSAAARSYFEARSGEKLENIVKAPLVSACDTLSSDTLSDIYRTEVLKTSQSQIESYLNCPFGYACKYILGLEKKATEDTEYNEIGTVVHSVFEHLIKTSIEAGTDFSSITDEKISEEINGIVAGLKDEMLGGEEDPSAEQLFRRIGESTVILAENLRDEFAQSEFKPAFCELSFGMEGKEGEYTLPDICTNGENKVELRGTADRVDICEKDGKIYLRIVDYKTGKKEFNESLIKDGLFLQMLIYMRTLCECKEQKFLEKIGADDGKELCPAEVVYHIVSMPHISDNENADDEKISEKIRNSISRSGLLIDDEKIKNAIDKEGKGEFSPYDSRKNYTTKNPSPAIPKEKFEEYLGALDGILSSIAAKMRSGDVTATPKKKSDGYSGCTYCDMRPICRKIKTDDAASENEEN